MERIHPCEAPAGCLLPKWSQPGLQLRTPAAFKRSLSGGKPEAAAGAAEDELLRHLLTGEIDKVLPATMHRHHMLEVEFFQLGHNLAQIVVRGRRQVKAAYQRVNLFYAADLLSAFECVDDAGMPA